MTLGRLPVWVFGDNDAATASLIKGYSQKDDLSKTAGDFRLRVARSEAAVWIDRVESAANPADGPSPADDSLMLELGARYTEPVSRYLDQWVDEDPRKWFAR